MAKRYVSNKDESARLFESDFLEFFTHVHWSVPIILYVPVSLFLLARAVARPELDVASNAGLFLFGVFIWSLTEYLLHRFAFHYEPKSSFGRRIHFLTHGVHHDYPNDSKRLVMPPSVSIPLALVFYGVFTVVFGPVFVAPFFAGFLVGYVCYDEIHYATHHAPFKSGVFLWLKQHHILHHYQDSDRGFGVSSPLWDYVFGTMEQKQEKVESVAR